MRTEGTATPVTKEFSLEGGCILCGGDLQVRLSSEGSASTVCVVCRWISRPHMERKPDGIHVTHPAGLVG